ncbi:OLC1v1038507C1 [Oldenlandia corymbosa var. corymbosa]|uniref:OLC1v1038507C1 n=1 Tax=Oldenlandia corymbosa var. corymbosa TaxID=529605 RepID=A0AAV1D335_OLDCO|nr:OLC1v1038507C1 [Oldenlandia corymbosa var. corymbosa]
MEQKTQNNPTITTSTFTGVMELSKMGAASVPSSYILPPAYRPNLGTINDPEPHLAPIDMSLFQQPHRRPQILEEIRLACKELGFFQVINHGIPPSVMSGALDAATEFFDLPQEEKLTFASGDVNEPVRYGTSLNQLKDKIHFWRDFIKHYSHPISKWIDAWPSNPQNYKKQMGDYTQAVYMLHKQLVEIVFESLGLGPKYIDEDIEKGSQAMAVNCYPRCPQPDLVLGIPPHSDYGYLTIILQSQQGLEIMDCDNRWCRIPIQKGALVIQIGDQLEIMSNGQYRSPIHRATVNTESNRISIASLHSLALDRRVAPALELVNEQNPPLYRQGSFTEFLDFLSKNDVMERRYLDTLKINL